MDRLPPSAPPIARRGFLAGLAGTLLAIGALASGVVSLFFLLPPKNTKRQPTRVLILDEEDLPLKGVKRVEFSCLATATTRPMRHRVFVVKKQTRLFALSARCTHLGCQVDWLRHHGRFVCPCHGGMYDDEGRVVSGPPPASLARLPLVVRGGKVYLEFDGGLS